MFSTEAKRNADACRFCWMCRHLCPVGLMTGRERNTPRAKGLMVSLVERGYEFSPEMASDMYECCLCNACTHDCATGFEPPVFIRESRTMALVEDCVPVHVKPVIDNLFATGNLYGLSQKDACASLISELGEIPEKARVLLHMGSQAILRTPDMIRSAVRLLRKANVDFTLLHEEFPTGLEMGDLIGYTEEVRNVAAEAARQINATEAEVVVVLDPSNVRLFRQEFPKWGCVIEPQVKTATEYFQELVETGVLKPRKISGVHVSFHDPCRLARDLGETVPARSLLEAMGLSVREMFLHGEMTKCCGGDVLKSHSPDLARLTAQGRWQDFSSTGADTLVTACPGCTDVLGDTVPQGKRQSDLFALLVQSCEA